MLAMTDTEESFGMLNVCLVEDDLVAADLLKEYINADNLRIVSHYATGEEALANIPKYPLPDAVLMDIGLGGMTGIEVTSILKAQLPQLEIIMLTTFEDHETIVSAIKAGASGYMLKASSSREIREGIFEVCRGGSFLTGSVARKLLNEFQERPGISADLLEDMTKREHTILNKLINGDSYKLIAHNLDISVHTVNNHIRHIYRKLHVNSRSAAVAKALGFSDDSNR